MILFFPCCCLVRGLCLCNLSAGNGFFVVVVRAKDKSADSHLSLW